MTKYKFNCCDNILDNFGTPSSILASNYGIDKSDMATRYIYNNNLKNSQGCYDNSYCMFLQQLPGETAVLFFLFCS